MNRYVIETKQITKTYNPRSPFIALDHVDLHVSEGCIYGLIGDNGAGKSTLLKLLAGHIFPTNGELCLFGETEEKALCNIRKNIGCLIEYPCFVPGMTVEQTLHYYAIQKGVPDNKKIGEAIQLTGLSEKQHAKCKTLSLGQKQRLGLAVALLGEPQILILDEPINGLDPSGIVEFRSILQQLNEQKMINHLSTVGILGNVILTAFKLLAGIIGHSGAMISDAVHSLSDVFATFIAFLGVKLSKKSADSEHPYGHDRLECVASMVLAAILLATGIGIGMSGVKTIIAGDYSHLQAPGTIALVAAIVSILTKEGMFWYTRHYAKILDSAAFMADAWHHRSDAFSSVGSLIGIGGAMLGFPVLDPLASVVICIFILKVAFDIFKDALDKMLDTSCSEEYEEKLADYIRKSRGVERLDLLRTRMFGNKVYIDAEIAVDGALSLKDAHAIAEDVHDNVEKKFPNTKHIMIHVNPA